MRKRNYKTMTPERRRNNTPAGPCPETPAAGRPVEILVGMLIGATVGLGLGAGLAIGFSFRKARAVPRCTVLQPARTQITSRRRRSRLKEHTARAIPAAAVPLQPAHQ